MIAISRGGEGTVEGKRLTGSSSSGSLSRSSRAFATRLAMYWTLFLTSWGRLRESIGITSRRFAISSLGFAISVGGSELIPRSAMLMLASGGLWGRRRRRVCGDAENREADWTNDWRND